LLIVRIHALAQQLDFRIRTDDGDFKPDAALLQLIEL
jgi:hypothetical protein